MTRRLLCAVLITALATVLVSGASAQEPRSSHLLRLLRQTAAIAPDQDLVLQVRAAGAPAGSKITVEVHRKVAFRSDFQRSLDGKELGARLAPGPTVDAAAAAPITVPTKDLGLKDGVYPVTIDLVDDDGTRLDRLVTYLVRLPANRGDDLPLDVAVVLPAGAPPSLQTDGTTAVPTEARAAASAVLANPPGVAITVAASPELLDGLATSPDANDQRLLASLRNAVAGDEVVVTPYAAIDAAAWWNEGLLDSLAEQVDRGSKTLSQRLARPTTSTWIADRELNPGLVRWLRDRGVRRVVVPEETLSPLGRAFTFTLTQPFALEGINEVQAIAADTGLAAHVGATGDPVLDAHRLLADLAILYYDQPGAARRGTVVALPSDRPIDPNFVSEFLGALAPSPTGIFKASTVEAVFEQVPRADDRGRRDGTGEPLQRELVPSPAANLGSFPDRLRDASDDIASYRALVGPDNPRPDDLNRARLVAGDRSLDDRERQQYLDRVEDVVASEAAKIGLPERQTIRFTARDGVVPLALQNTTGYPVNVSLSLEGSKLEVPDHPDRTLALTLTEESTRVELRVRTRASGDSPLDVTITTPDGRIVLGATRVTVRSTAFSGLGVVLSVGALAFLLVWWGRHIVGEHRRRPRPRHAVGGH